VWSLVAQGASLDQAVDATQQAMIVTCEKWPLSSPHAFVRLVAKRVFVDLTRKARITRKLYDRLAVLYDRTPAPAADTTAIFEDEVGYVLGLLAQLPMKQRTVIAYKMDGLSDEEIAELTGQKVSTVRSNLRHARTKLKNLIRDRKE
jgi:RNA polymerase sigma factor (sigma-70 family)